VITTLTCAWKSLCMRDVGFNRIEAVLVWVISMRITGVFMCGKNVIFRKSCPEFYVVYLGLSSWLGLVLGFLVVFMSQQVCLLVSCLPIGCFLGGFQNWSLVVPLEYRKVNYVSYNVKLECSVGEIVAYCLPFSLSPSCFETIWLRTGP
jgi:hypothetical protein